MFGVVYTECRRSYTLGGFGVLGGRYERGRAGADQCNDEPRVGIYTMHQHQRTAEREGDRERLRGALEIGAVFEVETQSATDLVWSVAQYRKSPAFPWSTEIETWRPQ
jgi:hypothetical protein